MKDNLKEEINEEIKQDKKPVFEKKKLTMEEMTKKNEDSTPKFIEEEGESINDKVSLIAISELLNLEKLKTITRVKYEQVKPIVKLYAYSELFNIPFIKTVVDDILQVQISVNGLGRKELVSLVQQRGIEIETPQQQKVTSKNIFK